MRFQKACLFFGLMLPALSLSSVPIGTAAAQKPAAPALRAWCERPAAIFKVGDKATFLIQGTNDGQVFYRMTDDGVKIIKEGTFTLDKGKTFSLTGTLDHPGFLQLYLQQNKDKALAAAGFEPTKIEPTAKPPEDFDDFWDTGLKELAKVPLDAKLEDVPQQSTERVTCYKISLASVQGKRVHGWVSVPKGKGPFPAVLVLPGAGVYGIGPDKYHAGLGAISMNIIIHDMPVDETKEYYQKKATGDLKDYRDIGRDDKNKSYYRAAILGCVRCIDYLVSRPDCNQEIAVTGGSQGGALTLITCGLDKRVKLASPNVAAMCDHSGFAHERVGGWPHWLLRVGKDKDVKAKVLETSAYFDAVNFARKFKGKSLHGVGFIDTVCAPTTVYAAYNVMPEPKTMINSPLMGHATDPQYLQAREKFWKDNLSLKPPAK